MADDEQFSLCWNNFNSNLSAGFHESLCRGDLVDVTLAAEGQFVKAHRLVLSVCSPYFRKMFTQMPANQHAFVFLKDVSHTALKDLIQFMYCGEVNVKQEALPAFISTAEALQIKGLTDSDPPPSQSPAEPSTPTPQIQQITSPRVRQRTSTGRSYKIETVDDSGDDKQTTQIVIQTTAAPPQATITQQQHHQTQHLQQQQQQQQQTSQQPTQQQQLVNTATATTHVVTQKRPARNIASGPHIKRTKSTIDPLDTVDNTITVATPTTQQITVQTAVVSAATAVDSKPQQQLHHQQQQQQQQQSEPEYIDLPIELPTKSEPDYTEEAGEVESGEHEATYVEDDSYGELRYDESYFTENDDAGNATATGTTVTAAGVGTTATTSKAIKQQQQTSFSDSSYVETADQTNSDAQESSMAIYSATSRGRVQLIYGGQPFIFEKNLKLPNGADKKFWRCNQWWNQKCRSRVYTVNDTVVPLNRYHTHEEIVKRKKRARKVAAATATPHLSAAAKKAASNNKVAAASSTSDAITAGGGTIEVTQLGMHLKYEQIVADVTEVAEPTTITLASKIMKKP